MNLPLDGRGTSMNLPLDGRGTSMNLPLEWGLAKKRVSKCDTPGVGSACTRSKRSVFVVLLGGTVLVDGRGP